MAQKFRKVDPRTWTDEKVRRLDAEGKLLVLWLLTSSRVNRCGIVLWSPGLASEETGISPDSIDMVYDTVCDTLSWPRDQASGTLFLRRWWRYNRPDNESALKGFLSDLHDVPGAGLKAALLSAAQDLPAKWRSVYQQEVNRVAPTVSDTVSDTVSPQEKEKEKEKEEEGVAEETTDQDQTADKKERRRVEYDPHFERWWKAYPKKAGKEAAQKEWFAARQRLAIRHPDWSPEQVRAHLGKTALAYGRSWLGKHYALDPERWLKRGRFDDDPSVWDERPSDGPREPVDQPYKEH